MTNPIPVLVPIDDDEVLLSYISIRRARSGVHTAQHHPHGSAIDREQIRIARAVLDMLELELADDISALGG